MNLTTSTNPLNENLTLTLTATPDGDIEIHSGSTLLSIHPNVDSAMEYCEAYGFTPEDDGSEPSYAVHEEDTSDYDYEDAEYWSRLQ